MPSRPLLISADHLLIEHVQALAGAGGLELEVVTDPGVARGDWERRDQVLVGGDLCSALIGLPRRRDVAVVHWLPNTASATPSSLWQSALALGAEHVVALPEGDGWLAEHWTVLRDESASMGRLLAVAGACGGAGASSLTVGLATAAAHRGSRVLVIDGDFLGGGIDLLLGAEAAVGPRWPELSGVSGRLNAQTLAPSLPSAHGVTLISAARQGDSRPSTDAWQSILAFGQHNFDLTIADLGRPLAQHPELWWTEQDRPQLWCLVPSRIRPIAAAATLLHHWGDSWPGVELIARQCDRGIATADVARALGRSVLGTVPSDASVQSASELGEQATGAFAKACAVLAQGLLVQ